jgi:hypothetical protein
VVHVHDRSQRRGEVAGSVAEEPCTAMERRSSWRW